MAALLISLAIVPILLVYGFPTVARAIGSFLGWCLRKKTEGRRALLMSLMSEDEKSQTSQPRTPPTVGGKKRDEDWDGIVGFFHPFCNAGGGGERVLWGAIRAVQSQWPKAKCVVYTGDHDVTKDVILSRVKTRFNIELHAHTITFLYLSKRHWVLATTWPHFTLLGQSIGSIILAWDAFSLLVPDIFVDTMGYAFALGFCKFMFKDVPTGAYVHYPTISTDMLESLDPKSVVGRQGVNAGQGTGPRGLVKRVYWQLFADLYSWTGSSVDVVMTNSTWTQAHIQSLWGAKREANGKKNPIAVVYPSAAVTELEEAIQVSPSSEKQREPVLVYIAQFRPEKNHKLILESFSKFVKTGSKASKDARLVLIGSVRDDSDSKRVYELRLLVNELRLKGRVEFHLDAPWPDILRWLGKASVGVNGMWNEHFGIGVVEYQAAGLISVVHNSGGPKLDIVIPIDGQPTGFHASTAEEYAEGYEKALSVPDPLSVRLRARKSAKRFTDEEFSRQWLVEMGRLVAMKV